MTAAEATNRKLVLAAHGTRREASAAFVMKVGVGAGGHPRMPTWYRSGYGHDDPAPYYGER